MASALGASSLVLSNSRSRKKSKVQIGNEGHMADLVPRRRNRGADDVGGELERHPGHQPSRELHPHLAFDGHRLRPQVQTRDIDHGTDGADGNDGDRDQLDAERDVARSPWPGRSSLVACS